MRKHAARRAGSDVAALDAGVRDALDQLRDAIGMLFDAQGAGGKVHSITVAALSQPAAETGACISFATIGGCDCTECRRLLTDVVTTRLTRGKNSTVRH